MFVANEQWIKCFIKLRRKVKNTICDVSVGEEWRKWLARTHRINRTVSELRVTTHHQGIWAQLSASLMSAANHHAFYLTRNKASETGAAEPDQQLSKLTSLIGKVHIASRVLSFPQPCSREHYYFFSWTCRRDTRQSLLEEWIFSKPIGIWRCKEYFPSKRPDPTTS